MAATCIFCCRVTESPLAPLRAKRGDSPTAVEADTFRGDRFNPTEMGAYRWLLAVTTATVTRATGSTS